MMKAGVINVPLYLWRSLAVPNTPMALLFKTKSVIINFFPRIGLLSCFTSCSQSLSYFSILCYLNKKRRKTLKFVISMNIYYICRYNIQTCPKYWGSFFIINYNFVQFLSGNNMHNCHCTALFIWCISILCSSFVKIYYPEVGFN